MKNQFKRVLGLMLAMIMLMTVPVISMAEEATEDADVNLMSLLPIEEVNAYVDLTEFPLEKLMQMTVYELFSHLRNEDTDELIEIDEKSTSVWENFIDEEGEYLYDTWKVLGFEDSVNILAHYLDGNYYTEVIIGSGNQVDPENVRYLVDFILPSESSDMDLRGYIYDELYDFEVSEIVANISDFKTEDMESVEILWYVGDFIDSGYDFGIDATNGWIKLGYGESVKFAPTMEESHKHGWWDDTLKMVIKSNDTTAIYRVYVDYPEYVDMFDFAIYTQDDSGKRNEVEIDDIYGHDSRMRDDEGYSYFYGMYVDVKSYYSYEDEYYLGIKFTEDYADCDLKVINSWKYSEDKIRTWIADGKIPQGVDITKELVAPDMSLTDAGMKDYWLKNGDLQVMLCIISDNDIYIVPAMLGVYRTYDYADSEGIFTDVDGKRVRVYNGSSYNVTEEKKGDMWYYTEIITYYLKEGYEADDEYSLGMTFYDGDSHTNDASKVDKAVVGHFYSLEEAENAPDIKEQLFVEDMYEVGAGYKDNFDGEGVDFTVFSGDELWHFKIIAEKGDYVEEPENGGAPEVGFDDRYFSVRDLFDEDGILDTYVVPYEHDTYYSYGYQTILVNDAEVDMSAVSPCVELGYQAKVYYGDTMEPTTDDDYNKLLPRDFSKVSQDATRDPNNAVRYTVSAQDHINQKNYWITAVKKEEGAKLFVNGPDEREIFLNNYFGNAHDIFVANVGTEELTGINVTVDATNVKLDDYWTIGGEGNNTLAPFTTTINDTGNYHGELLNVAKIRLVPDGEGEIDGTLTITADGQEPRTITLSGTAGNPKIDTEEIHDAVKYVPYSAIVTTNNMHDWNKVTFSLYDGTLPKGLKLYPSGEIYGVPKETGEFPITLRARYSHGEFDDSYADFVLTVKDNTDENINASVDSGYEITTRLPATISKYADMDFVIDGEFEEFMDLWLDGEKLAEDVDYTAKEGSTKITIKSKTFTSAGNGKHTISAEFRVGGDKNNELKTSSQNFTIGESSSVSRGGGGSSLPTYVVNFVTNGGSNVGKQSIRKGKTLVIVPTPVKEGYTFAGWYKDEALTQPFDALEKITSKLNLYAKWEKVVSDETPAGAANFADVTSGDWFYEDVQWAYANKLMVGYNDAQFAPTDTITSSMVVTVLASLANADVTAYENKIVEGVEAGQWYTPYANWAKEVGIAEDISFAESAEITREMMAVVLDRFFGYMKKEFAVTQELVIFADGDLVSDKAMNAMQTLYKLGIFKGKGNNVIDPLGKTTRAEFAALMHRVDTLLNK